ncbi:MAG: SGNH/GDSL hydrolase family protein [Bacillota bacterium]|nr:SGNH/GDSL hydrolase family protein [Bacillota bacterium]
MDIIPNKTDYRFLVSGDSISRGVVFDERKGKYSLLENSYVSLLQNALKGVVYNLSKFGNTVIKGLGKLQKDVQNSNPDIVLIEFGGNDCDFNWPEIAKDPAGIHEPHTEYNLFQKLLKDSINTLKHNKIIPVLLTMPPLDADRYFKWISQNSAETGKNILQWLGSITKIYWWQERYNSAILNIAEETETKWIDIRGAFLQYPDFPKLLCADGIHPNENGHKVIAQKILEYIKPYYSFLLK